MPNAYAAVTQDGFVPPVQAANDSSFVQAVGLSGVNPAHPKWHECA
jgi:hypothetical protein